jgi:hypothetical protein
MIRGLVRSYLDQAREDYVVLLATQALVTRWMLEVFLGHSIIAEKRGGKEHIGDILVDLCCEIIAVLVVENLRLRQHFAGVPSTLHVPDFCILDATRSPLRVN